MAERSRRDEEFEPIDVRMSISPTDECECPPGNLTTASVRQSFTLSGGRDPACQMVLSGEEAGEYRAVDPCDACPCFVFSTHECVAEVVEVRDGRLIYSVTLPHRKMLAPLVADLRDAGATVSVTRILAASDDEDDPPALTDKQRETLLEAIDAGYYDRPRGASLDDIADELGITPSAASQRLNSVERRLIDKYVRQFDAGTTE